MLKTQNPATDITQGMQVYDVNGNTLGRVNSVTLGDRATDAPTDPNMLPDNLDGHTFDNLMADGFIRMEHPIFSSVTFASLLDVDRVTSDALHLTLDQRDIIRA